MKKIITALICIVCIVSIIAGKIHWDNKINAAANAGSNSQQEKDTPQEKANSKAKDGKDIAALTANFPEELTSKVEKAIEEEKPLTLLAMGSSATAKGDGTWTTILQEELDKTYGDDVFHIEVKSFGEDLSIDVAQQQKYKEAVEQKPDIFLLEPFLLKDNGKVAIENSLDSVEMIINAMNEESEDTIIMLQPANPIYNAVHYPEQVKALKEYAKENNIIYLDHWKNWPDQTNEEILEYLHEEDKSPNEKGQKLWAEYLVKYFTGDKL